ncbi:hypothetical protein NE237_010347 [Protea cynaroides]|uniref:BED-type domain-containing protein n=1 Tax=Protea cynaroides TaxID=273540 RepID=A0A9Q0KZ47_9MAGN|nr:hypothetical protein NE237_010347 [Protea cynaroides]
MVGTGSNSLPSVLSSAAENTVNTSTIDPSIDPARKAKSKDPGWKYGYWPNLANKAVVRCSLCGRDCNQGIKRLKQHLAGGYGDIAKCTKVSVEISKEMRDFIMKNKKRKVEDLDDPMDDERRNPKKLTQTNLQNWFRSVEQKKIVDQHIANWIYKCGIPFNIVKDRDFQIMLESVAQYGSGYEPPSYHELRGPLLKSVKEEVVEMKKKYEMYWKQYGCTLICDGWTDKRGRHLINFLVNCTEGTYFMESIDASLYIKDANLLFQLLDKKIEEIGEENVVQVITDNTANYKVVGTLLMNKRSQLYWTPCASHCIDLMLEDIGNLKLFKGTIAKGRRVTSFIYRHNHLLEAMRARIGGKELVGAGVTRFATSFLTLQSMFRNRDALKQLFVSDDWMKCNLSKTEIGMKVTETLLSIHFWNSVQDCLRASQPLVIVLRIVDGDEDPAMSEVYLAMEEAKKMIQSNFADKERLWKRVVNIIDKHWECQMGYPLYVVALFLNPGKFFEYTKNDYHKEGKIQCIFNEVLVRMVPDLILQDKISDQAITYKLSQGTFREEMAIKHRNTMSPLRWWTTHGSETPDLMRFAFRILGLCCSSGREHNWSTFEFIHTKKRNRLENQRLNDLGYIKYNQRLKEKFRARREQSIRSYDPLMLDELDWSCEWMTGHQEEDIVHNDLTWANVDRAMGASTSIEGRNRVTRAQASGINVYARRVKRRGSVEDDSDGEDIEEEEDVNNNDEDVEDDFGQRSIGDSGGEQQEQPYDPTLFDDF